MFTHVDVLDRDHLLAVPHPRDAVAIDALRHPPDEMLPDDAWSETSGTVLRMTAWSAAIAVSPGPSSLWWPALVTQSGRQIAAVNPRESTVAQDEQRHASGRRSSP